MNLFAHYAAVLLCSVLTLASVSADGVDTSAPSIFLIAKPELQDPNFAQSVVLVVFPKDGGPVGVILNRPTRLTLKDGFPGEAQLKDRGDTLYFGGPVQTEGLMYLFRGGGNGNHAFAVVGDLYLSADARLLDQLLSTNPTMVQR